MILLAYITRLTAEKRKKKAETSITLSFSTLLLQINNHNKAQKSPIFTQEKSTKFPPPKVQFFVFFVFVLKLQSNKKVFFT